MKVKICGISNEIDALCAIEKGADAIGFVMGGRVLPIEVEPLAQHVRETIKKFPSGIDSFVVTHLFNGDDILSLASYVNSTGIQISEDIPLEEVIKIRNNTDRKIIKTVVTNDLEAKTKLKMYEPYCDYFLLDSRYGGYTGGTGVTNNWEACKELIELTDKPVFIAGGLDPSNVAEAIRITNPYAVDVSTGISCYGPNYLKKDRKNSVKIETFINIANEKY